MELREINLELGEDHDHNEISTNDKYLCLIGGTYWVGTFKRTNRGLIFHGWHDNAILYDKPGINDSHWNKVYQILETVDEALFRVDIKKAQTEKWRPRSKKVVRNSSGKVILKYKPKNGE